MSQVGAGIAKGGDIAPALAGRDGGAKVARSGWNDARASLFRSAGAGAIGDIVTIDISIDERATLGNQSDRSKDAAVKSTFDYLLDFLRLGSRGKANMNLSSTSSSSGRGSVQRSERIRLAVAAVVTRVLDNGNVLVSGSQEIRVNYELRVLHIEGVVRPQDISPNNRVSYDKVAEARVSYGGRGRIMEVQQPQLGHQVYDLLRPF